MRAAAPLLLGLALFVALGCSAHAPLTTDAPDRLSTSPAALDDAGITHLLNRLTYGPRPGDVERVRALGVAAYLERQLHPETIDDSTVERALATLPSLELPIAALLREYPRPGATGQGFGAAASHVEPGAPASMRDGMTAPPPRPARIVAELRAARLVRAVASERQLQEVMVDFWFNHFNVFAGKGVERWYVSAYEREAIRPHALGKFSDLVRATARHPAMLYYLDNWLSRRARLNENYARELMELHTLGVDGGYTQADVTEVARAFTGWTIDSPQRDAASVFRPAMHDVGAKRVLGHPIAAWGGERDGEIVIDILTRHPSTARFIAGKLARRFVADDPPAALVERVAATYLTTDGDIREMLRTLVAAPEFLDPGVRRAKVKKPLELVASAVRALDGRIDARGGFALARATAEMGEPLYAAQPPTGYPDRADAWISTGSVLARMNFAAALAARRYAGVEFDPRETADGTAHATPDAVALMLGSPQFQRR